MTPYLILLQEQGKASGLSWGSPTLDAPCGFSPLPSIIDSLPSSHTPFPNCAPTTSWEMGWIQTWEGLSWGPHQMVSLEVRV